MNTARNGHHHGPGAVSRRAGADHPDWRRRSACGPGAPQQNGRVGRRRPDGSLSFGYQALSETPRSENVLCPELFQFAAHLLISPKFRYADDAASGAVQWEAPSSISVFRETPLAVFVVTLM